jgi:hypothetical protein
MQHTLDGGNGDKVFMPRKWECNIFSLKVPIPLKSSNVGPLNLPKSSQSSL